MGQRISFREACATYVHRFTTDHVPQWARQPRPDGGFYAPRFESDAAWYAATTFPGEAGHLGGRRHCYTGTPTWPLGQSLAAPYNPRKGI